MNGAGVMVAALAGAVLAAPSYARAEAPDQNGAAAAGARPPTDRPAAAPSAPRAAGKLKLGPFADPYARVDDATLAELLRFEQHIEVHGKAPHDLEVAMAAWWEHFNFEYAIYGRGYNIQKPVHPGAVNILPLIDWVKKKIKEGRQNKAPDQ